MTYLELRIQENTPAARNIEAFAEAQHVSPEEAALKLLASLPLAKTSKASPAARRIVGLFSAPEDAAVMNDAMELVTSERQRRNAELPRDL